MIGGYFAGIKAGPILLTTGKDIKVDVANYLAKETSKTFVLGGKNIVGRYVVDLVNWLIGDQASPKPATPIKIPPSDQILKDKKLIRAIVVEYMKEETDEFTITLSPKFDDDEIEELIADIEDWSYRMASGVYLAEQTQMAEKTVIRMYYDNLTTTAENAYVDREVKRIVREIIDPGMTDFEKVWTVHNYIINNYRGNRSSESPSHNLYQLLEVGRGSGLAYTFAFIRFMEEVNINSHYLYGELFVNGGEPYGAVWSKVELDGEWYNINIERNTPTY